MEGKRTEFGKKVLGESYLTPEQREEADKKLEKMTGRPVITIFTKDGPETIIG